MQNEEERIQQMLMVENRRTDNGGRRPGEDKVIRCGVFEKFGR